MTSSLGAHRVVIVGGGLAGISAALDCLDRDIDVTLIERRSHLGGLTWSFEHNGLIIDNGQHVFLRCCTEYLAMLDRIGSRADVFIQRRLDVPVIALAPPGGQPRSGRLSRSGLPAPLHLAGSLLRFPFLTRRQRLGLGRAVNALARLDLDDAGLDRTTFATWLETKGQSAAAIAAVWDLITIPTVNLPARQASLAMAAKVFQTGLLTDNAAADIGWSEIPLGTLHGERALGTLRRRGATVLTGTKVTGIGHGFRPETGRPIGPVSIETDHGSIEADAVIVALPHDAAGRVLPPGSVAHQERLEELGSSAIVDIHLVFDRKVSPYRLMAAHGSAVQWVFDRSEASGTAQAHGPDAQYLAVSISAADDFLARRPGDLVTAVREELGRLLPAAGRAHLLDSLVTKEHRATFRAVPGSAALRPDPATTIPGLTVAGAWTNTGWPATMEGAVRSGRAAAATCVTHLEKQSLSMSTTEEVA